MPSDTFRFFKELALKACTYAGKSKKARCSHDVKTIDEHVIELWEIGKKYESRLP